MTDRDNSFSTAVASWIDENSWPRSASNVMADEPQSISVFTRYWFPNSYGFRSAFRFFEVQVTHATTSGSLIDLEIRLVVPGKSESTTLMVVDSYPLSTAEGQPLTFNLDDGYIRGTLSFKYKNYNGRQDIFVTYSAHLPYAGDLEDTVNIAPARLDEAAGFTAERLKAIPTLTVSDSELKLVEEKARSEQVVIRALAPEKVYQQSLLLKFLRDFVIPDEDNVVIETYYTSYRTRTNALSASGESEQWQGSISFFSILELVGSVDPTSFTISAVLYARIPIAGRVRITGIEGSLLGEGVSVDVNVQLAHGKATFTASQNSSGKHDIFVEASVTIKFYGTISSSGKDRLFTLPF